MSPNVTSNKDTRAAPCILITGGAGFVGSPLVSLLQQWAQVVVVDDLSVGRPFPPAHPALTCHQLDIRAHADLQGIFAQHRPDAVIHLAAIHHIPTCEQNPYLATEVNVMGFQSVLDASHASGCQRVILASSGAVYAWHDHRLSETSTVGPQDVYAASKAANEHQLTAWTMAGRGVGTIARMFNVIGPNDPNGHLIPDILRRLDQADGQHIQLRMGNIDRRRDFVDVHDMAAGFGCLVRRALGEEVPTGQAVEVFNLCSGRDYTAQDIAERLALLRGVQADITSDPALRRPLDRQSQLGDPSKANAVLGWQAGRDLTDSLREIVQTWQSA